MVQLVSPTPSTCTFDFLHHIYSAVVGSAHMLGAMAGSSRSCVKLALSQSSRNCGIGVVRIVMQVTCSNAQKNAYHIHWSGARRDERRSCS